MLHGKQTQMAVMKSSYYSSLEGGRKLKYEDKLKALRINDPYMYSKTDCIKDDSALWPRVEYPNIYNYLVSTKTRYTREELKAHKSLEVYKNVVDGRQVSNVSLYITQKSLMVEANSALFLVMLGTHKNYQLPSSTYGLQ